MPWSIVPGIKLIFLRVFNFNAGPEMSYLIGVVLTSICWFLNGLIFGTILNVFQEKK